MTEIKKLDLNTSAILTLDCQKGITSIVQGAERIFTIVPKVLEAARSHKLRVIHVGIGFRPGHPEIHPEHPMFATIHQSNRFVHGTESTEFHSSMNCKSDEIRIVKHRISAFSGNDLEMILRSQGITNLVLFGISTSGIVLSTLRQAADLDFRCIVIKDCCFDGDEEVHRVLTEKVFTRQATVVDSNTFLAQMI